MAERVETKPLRNNFYENGKNYFDEKKYQEAIDCFLAAIKESPEDSKALFELGKTYYVLEEHMKAINYLKKNLAISPQNSNAHAILGKCYIFFDDYNLAIEELNKACLVNSTGDIYFDLGMAYETIGEYRKSIEAFKKARELGQDLTSARLQLGRAYRESGEYDLSTKELEALTQIPPYNEEIFYKNNLLNEIEISQQKTVIESKPMVLGVALTHRCNIRCKMCRYWSDPWDIPEVIKNEIIQLFPYLKNVYWQGGEPFFSEYFSELFEKASEFPRLSQTIVTNGILINEAWAKKLVKANVNIIWSIDSPDKNNFEKIRLGAKYKQLIECINIVNKCKKEEAIRNKSISKSFKIIMQSTIMKDNYQEIEGLVEFAKYYEFDGINLIPIRNVTGEENIFYHKDKEATEFLKKVLPVILRKDRGLGFKIFNQLPIELDTLSPDSGNNSAQTISSKENIARGPAPNNGMLCYWPWKSLYLLYRGKVRPYGFCEHDIGNVNKDLLKDLWNCSLIQEYRSRLLNNLQDGHCSKRCTSGVIPQRSLKLD